MARLESLRELTIDEIKDLYDAEQQILEALPTLEEASSPELKDAASVEVEVPVGSSAR
jgi:ferritin-like metal-binding protein YciE